MDLLMSFFLIPLKSTFLFLLNNTAMLYYISYHSSASNGEQIQNGNNGKKTWSCSDQRPSSANKNIGEK